MKMHNEILLFNLSHHTQSIVILNSEKKLKTCLTLINHLQSKDAQEHSSLVKVHHIMSTKSTSE